MSKVLTISIAAYNVERYLNDTLSSLVIPEIMEELEVIVIDDGSTDNTLKLAREYESKYPLTFKVVSKDNGGYGSTVNWSVKHATGKYFKLLDGDDWIDPNGLTKLVGQMKTTNVDAFITNTIEASETGTRIEQYSFLQKYDDKVISTLEASTLPVVAMWAYAFRLDLLRNQFEVLPEHTLYTDQLYVSQALSRTKEFKVLNSVVYYWRVGREEQSNNKNSVKKHYKELLLVSDLVKDFYKRVEPTLETGQKRYLLKRVAGYYSYTIAMLCLLPRSKSNLDIIKNLELRTQKEFPEIYQTAYNAKKLSLLRKTKYLLYWGLK